MTHVPWHDEMIDHKDMKEVQGVESVEMISVGIDIGTTTTHLLFSRLLARRRSSEYSSDFQIVNRETFYESSIILTPYNDEDTIDAEAIDKFIHEAYTDAGYTPDDIDTGAVIVTGEASRKENAEAIASLFSERTGKFVCATAGPNLESLMSAHGSGAVDYSVDKDLNILHVDIGGGTTKIAYIDKGFVKETGSINIGAHLIEFDDSNKVTKIEDAARKVAADIGMELNVGKRISLKDKDRLSGRFAELVFNLIDGEISGLTEELMVTDIPERGSFDAVTFAGGVSEYIYGREPGYYNDLGPKLGEAVRKEANDRRIDVAQLESGIRATVLGSTQHNTQISGNTITLTNNDILPLRNIPMVPFVVDEKDNDYHDHDHRHEHHHEAYLDDLTRDVLSKLKLYNVDELEEGFAFGLHIHGLPTYDRLSQIAESLIVGWKRFDSENPIIVAFDSDVAMNAGRIITENIDAPVIAIDGVELDQFGYIDIGEPLEDTNAVPLTVKSLVFKG